jgi:hypothetical protein
MNWETNTKRSEEIREKEFNNLWIRSLPGTVKAVSRVAPSGVVATRSSERADPAPSHECSLDDQFKVVVGTTCRSRGENKYVLVSDVPYDVSFCTVHKRTRE